MFAAKMVQMQRKALKWGPWKTPLQRIQSLVTPTTNLVLRNHNSGSMKCQERTKAMML
jgi:hypothetical protein